MKAWIRMAVIAGSLLRWGHGACAQALFDPAELRTNLSVSGYEQELAAQIAQQLGKYSPKKDNLGDVYVTVGSGAPHRLIVTPVDEPGYVVSEITVEGYLRVQRLPQGAPNPVFDTLHFAQPVWVVTRSGKKLNGVFAGLSVHLQPGRQNAPKMNHQDELYVDIGAKSAEEVRAAGVNLLDPIGLQRSWAPIGGNGEAGPAVVDRLDIRTLGQLLEEMKDSKAKGTTTIAFVTQQWTGGRGLNRILTETHPDEMIYVGRIRLEQPADGKTANQVEPKPGAGIVVGSPASTTEPGKHFVGELQALADKKGILTQIVAATPPRIASYVKGAAFPERFVELGVPTLWPATPAEYALWRDAGELQKLLEAYLEISKLSGGLGAGLGAGLGGGHEEGSLEALVTSYGASGHEGAVRRVVLNRLDARLQKKVTTDAAGNLVLHLGDEKTPRLVFIAHMDEIGYEVKKIEDDGRLQVEVLGGGFTQYFLGHVVLVHKKDGNSVGGVLELPEGWDKPGFEWPSGPKAMDEPAHVYVGAKSRAETEKLGIQVGDFVTIPKEYRPLLGTRANARSFDDRVGCAALIAAVNAIGPELPGRDVKFVWSTEEEVGLKGAAAFAEQAAKEGRVPDFVFAIDTFVSSDSPLESKRFADAKLGDGFVVRAVDNSNIVPLNYLDRVVATAKENAIPVQYGVTGGGNDGAVFFRYGSVDVALGWPLRYSHSPAEVIDTKDLDALGKIIAVLAKNW